MWYRAFGNTLAPVPWKSLLEHLHNEGFRVRGDFRGEDIGDEDGWFEADLQADHASYRLDRYLATEKGVRAELNSWAAWIELTAEEAVKNDLMQRIIASQQVFCLQAAENAGTAGIDPLCASLCNCLAVATDGLIQIDRLGIMTIDGTIIVPEKEIITA